jgi:integrase/recombinase XerD
MLNVHYLIYHGLAYFTILLRFRRCLLQTLGISISRFTFDHCSRECVLEFMQYLADLGIKPGTRNHRLAALKSYIRYTADKDVAL